ncbi:MAG: heavy-metal-associated domain-containing protein [Wenzhouxiangella sp.]
MTWSRLQGLQYGQLNNVGVPEMQANPFKLLISALLITLAGAVTAQPESGHYLIHVDGLACPFCAYGIEKQLKKIDGVDKLETDVEKGRVVVVMAEGQALERADVEQAVRDAGFTLRDFESVGANPDNSGP